MGKTTTYLLVKLFISYLFISINMPCFANVDASHYNEFWLWSGVKAQPILKKASTIYLLRGQIINNYNQNTYLINQRNPIILEDKQQLWLVYRAHTLNWNDSIFTQLNKELKYWQINNIPIQGIQIDFDVPTQKLSDYISFLEKTRAWLPKNYRLSITGLLDWGSHADPSVINHLANTIDEVIFQTYQGRETIKDYQRYLKTLQTIQTPFKIGIIQYGEWQPLPSLEKNPYFKGYVVFLQNES